MSVEKTQDAAQSQAQVQAQAPEQTQDQAPVYELVGCQDGYRYQLGGVTEVGRWAGNDLVINRDGVSRLHARIWLSEDGVMVEDLQSANGTYVNGNRISEATKLQLKDHVRFDSYSFALYDQSDKSGGASKSVDFGAQQLPPEWESKEQEATRFITSEALEALRQQEKTLPIGVPANGQTAGIEDVKVDRLVGVAGPMSGMVFPLLTQEKLMWEIGRCETSDIYVSDETVSRCHASLSFGASGWRLVSKMAKNGVIVNQQKRLSCKLKSGDTIRLGAVELQFRLAE